MKLERETKAFLVILSALLLTGSASAYESQFTTSPPDTQTVGEEFTIAGEVSKSGYWESDLESIMIQSSPEGSSNWYYVEENDDDCYGDRCTVSYDQVSHDTAEEVEYRIVAQNTAPNTVPYNPAKKTVEFVEEQGPAIELIGVSASDYSVSESDGSTTLEADVRNNRDSLLYVSVEWTVDGETLASDYFYISSDSTETVTKEVTYATLENSLDTDTGYDLEATAEYGSVSDSRTAPEPLVVEPREQEDPSVDISNIRSTDTNIEEGDTTRFKVDLRPNQEIGYVEVSFNSDGETLESEEAYNLDGGQENTVSSESLTWNNLKNQLPTGQDHDLEVQINYNDKSNSDTTNNVFFLAEADEEEPDAELNSVSASDYQLSPGDETELRAEVENNMEQLSYVRITWKAEGTVLVDDWEYVSAESTETITRDISYYTIRGKGLSTGEDYDLEGRLRFNSVDVSDTAPENLRLLEEDETYSITDYGPSGTVESPVELFVNLDSNPSTGWCKWEEGNSVDRESSTLMAKPDSSVAEWRYDQEFSEGSHTVSFQCFNNDRSITGEETATFTVEDEETEVELKSVSASDYRVSSGEETELRARVENNKAGLAYVRVTWKADGTVIANKWDYISGDSTETVSKDISYSSLRDQDLSTGDNYDLEGRLRYNSVDVTETASNTLYLVPGDSDEQRMEIEDLWSTDTYIEDGEDTDFKARVEANEDVSYVEVDFYVDGEKVAENELNNLDSGDTRTVSSTLTWDELETDFSTGQYHDLEVRVSNYQIDLSRTENNEFYLAGTDEDSDCEEFSDSDLDVDLVNFESIPVEGNNYNSRAKLINNGDRDVGGNLGLYIKESSDVPNCEFYDDHFDDLVGFTGGNVYPDRGDSDSFSFSYSGTPLSGLEYGETYHLVAVFGSDSTTYVGPAGAIQWQRSDDDEDDDRDPTARFSWDDHPVVEDESVRFDASASTDPDGDIEQYRWDFEDGTGYSYGSRVSHTFTRSGTYDVQLRVRDSNGNTDFKTREVEVVEDIGDCSVNVGRLRFVDAIITRGESTQASITVRNEGEDQHFTVRFKVGGNTVRTVDREISSGSQSTFTASVGPETDSIVNAEVETEGSPCGSRTYERHSELVVVEDGDDGDDDQTYDPEAWYTWTPSQPQRDETVTFDASGSSDSDGGIVEYQWYLGDGSTTRYGRTVQHSYDNEGDYDVQLVVEDSEGNTDSVTRTVPVVEDPDACSIRNGRINFDDPIITRGESTTGRITISNLGEEQVVNVRFKVGNDVVKTREVAIGANSQRTFTANLSPEVDKIVTVEVRTSGDPCGTRNYDRHSELVVVEGGDQSSTLNVNVRADDGKRLYNTRVAVTGDGSTTRYTGANGEAHFELGEGDYNVRVSKSGYSTETRNVDLVPGEHRSISVTLDRRESGQGTLTALVEGEEGERLEDAEITVRNGVNRYRETDSNGRATVDLDQGTYTVTAEKTGYGSWTESVHIDRGEDTVRVFRLTGDAEQGLNIADVRYPDSVCRGSTMRPDVVIENNAGYHELVSLTGKGLGSINLVRSFSLDTGETVEKTLTFTNVQGSGTEQFTVTANNQESDSVTRTVNVESCGVPQTGQASDISMELGYTVKPNMAVYGDILRVNGFVDGKKGRAEVKIKVDGQTKASVRTQPDGYYQTWITADEVGTQTVTAEADDVSASRPLRVIPTSQVTGIEAPVSVFEGQTFQVCAQVDSQIQPEVILERDGEVVTSKQDSGRVCFERQARQPGTHAYRIAALTSGEGNTASTTVEVLEMDVEASSFPGQIASVESGSGIVKLDLYNANENQTRYELKLEGLPDTWISQSEKQVILDKGERRTVYFYLTPQEEGTYQPTISVDSRGTEIYREELDVITGGTTRSRGQGGFFHRLAEGLQDLFTL